ncbi:MAG: hypothetical protein HY776_08380 [Actinobacteria bacterium]|nr:hypothetical protein [Actinomycetota bacterium]
MTRLNITLPDEIAKQLAEKRNKSRFIAEALEEKLEREKRKKIERLLREGYKASSKEDKKLNVDWEKAGLEKWD